MCSSDRTGLRPVQEIALSSAWRVLWAVCIIASCVASAAAEPPPAVARGYLDPSTGLVTTDKPTGVDALELSAAELEMLSTSDEGLALRRSAGRALSVDLQGRFRHMSFATIGRDGELQSHCVGAVSAKDAPSAPTPNDSNAHDQAAHGAAQ